MNGILESGFPIRSCTFYLNGKSISAVASRMANGGAVLATVHYYRGRKYFALRLKNDKGGLDTGFRRYGDGRWASSISLRLKED